MSAAAAPPAVETVTILGSGPAGLTAAVYAARANLSPLVLEGDTPGGQLTITSEVENFPGFAEPVLGPDLIATLKKQAERFGTRFRYGAVSDVDLSKRPFTLTVSDGTTVRTETLIIATGATAKWLGLANETRLQGRGVSACATCDGFFFKSKDVVVVEKPRREWMEIPTKLDSPIPPIVAVGESGRGPFGNAAIAAARISRR